MTNNNKHQQTIIIIVIVIINLIVKGKFLANNSLGGDEPFSVYIAQMDVTSIIRLLSEGNNPPLYEILLHFWIKIFGISEFSVRFPSLLFSCITVYFIYKIGIKFLNKRIALYSGIIFIFSNYHILLAHESRAYSLLGMLTAISMYFFIGIINDYTNNSSSSDDTKRFGNSITMRFVLLSLVNTVIVYSHYFGFFVLIVQFLYLTFNFNFLIKLWKQVLLYSGIVIILYSPFISVVVNRFILSSGGTWVGPPNGIVSIYNMLWTFSNAPVVTACVIAVLIISLIKFIIRRKEAKNPNYYFIVFWFVFIFLFMFGVSYRIPMFLNRYLMVSAIAFILVLGISIDSIIKKHNFSYIVPVIMCIMFIVTVKPNLTNKRNVKEAVVRTNQIKDSNTIVLISPSNFVLDFAYYYNKEYFKDYNTKDMFANANRHLNNDKIYGINNINEINLKNRNKVVFLDAAADFSNPDNNIRNELEARYKLKNSFKVYEIYNIYEYELR
ncbi:MAG TPA: glycosyltransferase family 39 protein [Lentimicrobium sp.]|nr:glycosyltransferase family 39 protein [Lentimicrobium sp.]